MNQGQVSGTILASRMSPISAAFASPPTSFAVVGPGQITTSLYSSPNVRFCPEQQFATGGVVARSAPRRRFLPDRSRTTICDDHCCFTTAEAPTIFGLVAFGSITSLNQEGRSVERLAKVERTHHEPQKLLAHVGCREILSIAHRSAPIEVASQRLGDVVEHRIRPIPKDAVFGPNR